MCSLVCCHLSPRQQHVKQKRLDDARATATLQLKMPFFAKPSYCGNSLPRMRSRRETFQIRTKKLQLSPPPQLFRRPLGLRPLLRRRQHGKTSTLALSSETPRALPARRTGSVLQRVLPRRVCTSTDLRMPTCCKEASRDCQTSPFPSLVAKVNDLGDLTCLPKPI